ncbi:hypothetical protein ASG97_08560 [Bacillus sp. Soil745]|nr:hypothetical protein ASG97_08560 [Bacillus sp. Soil745]PAW30686.1 hypothetical protein BKC07_03735 [Peribacillus simplex]
MESDWLTELRSLWFCQCNRVALTFKSSKRIPNNGLLQLRNMIFVKESIVESRFAWKIMDF